MTISIGVQCTLVTLKALDQDTVHLLKIKLLSLKKTKTSNFLRARRIKGQYCLPKWYINIFTRGGATQNIK